MKHHRSCLVDTRECTAISVPSVHSWRPPAFLPAFEQAHTSSCPLISPDLVTAVALHAATRSPQAAMAPTCIAVLLLLLSAADCGGEVRSSPAKASWVGSSGNRPCLALNFRRARSPPASAAAVAPMIDFNMSA